VASFGPLRSPAVSAAAGALHVILLGGWLGAMAFFAAVTAPAAFAVLPTRELAGALVTRALDRLDLAGLFLGPLCIVAAIGAHPRGAAGGRLAARLALVAGMTLAHAVSRTLVSPRMLALRLAMGDIIDRVAADHPLRAAFNQLHHLSVGLMAASLLAGLAALLLALLPRRP
jgi:hypothetical protein